MENSIEFFLNTYLEWSLSRQDLVITEWHIKTFTQGKKHIVDFLIEFMALASKAQTNN